MALNRRKISIIAVLLVLLILAVAGCGKKEVEKKSVKKRTSKKREVKPGTLLIPSPLDGIKAAPEKVNRQALAVMVENLVNIRPQAGISQASLVVEGLAEGGITRFMLVYLEKDADNIGPIRSARSHFVALAKGWDALYAHVGGSKFALADIKRFQLDDLDQYAHASGYHRIKSARAPHNVFSSTEKLRKIKKSTLMPPPAFSFKSDADKNSRPGEQSILIDFSFSNYAVKWVYDKATNKYKRFNGGRPHKDAATGKQLEAKNILIMYAPTFPITGTPLLDIKTVGQGRLQVMRDGEVLDGEWFRQSVDSPLVLKDSSGNNIELDRGQVWLELVKPTTPVKISTTQS